MYGTFISPEMCLSIFFFITRPPPRSTLFPTRRSSDLASRGGGPGSLAGGPGVSREPSVVIAIFQCRSEEHTSELQSRFDLVCRLLLEKKKRKKNCSRGKCTYK